MDKRIEGLSQKNDGIKQLRRGFPAPNFNQALKFIGRVVEMAEAEGHHPAILLLTSTIGFPTVVAALSWVDDVIRKTNVTIESNSSL